MIGFLVICLLSFSTLQTIGDPLNNSLPARRVQSNEQIYYNNDLYDGVNERNDEGEKDLESSELGNDKMSHSAEDNEKSIESAAEENQESRRMFEWFTRLFRSTTPKAIYKTESTTESSFGDLEERIFLETLHKNLTDVMVKLSEIDKHVSVVMSQKKPYASLTREKPQIIGLDKFIHHDRSKRDVSNVKAENVTKKPLVDEHTEINKNLTDNKVIKVNETDCKSDNVTNFRRVGNPFETSTDVKNKLLLYLQESFQEIDTKIMSLKDIKDAFSDNVSFKIGYILANIDTLEVSMANLKQNMDKNKELWEDTKILDLYDTLKVSNQAVSGLIETLKTYIEELSRQQPTKTVNSIN